MFGQLKSKLHLEKPKTLGQLGEEFAQVEYKKLGYEIVAKNEFNKKGKRLGEIDFIAKQKNKIVFVEVKTRTVGNSKFGKGVESVDRYKQIKILKAVKVFLLSNRQYLEFIPQIDVCLLEFNEIDKTFKPAKILMNVVEDFT
jgi:putative endonuclease